MNASRLGTVWVLAKREIRSSLYGYGIYLAVLISQVIASFVLINYLRAVTRDGMLITASPLAYPLFIATAVCAIYLALAAVTSISREKDMQTLEVLFYGPVDYVVYILAKYIKGLLSYGFIVLFFAVYFAAVSMVCNLGISAKFWGVILLSLFLSSCVITFGIFVSTLSRSVRTSVVLFLGIVGALVAVQVIHGTLTQVEEAGLSLPVVYLRNTLGIINSAVKWVSPFYYLNEGMEAVSIGSFTKYALSGGASLVYSAAALLLSTLVLKRKGVRKSGGM
ncbi:MAG: ABC transporter permease subunit [Deltaproteobacteria bacterium]|nr:ABC transporter permease subunit [Deltaproteobacteria bacterium]MBW2120884.1 ABC transporter permease subunit [Deltaproteobacteria bacterium]